MPQRIPITYNRERKVAAEHTYPDAHIETAVGAAAAADAMLRIARARQADLIVLGADAPRLLTGHTSRTVAYETVCQAACPVLTVTVGNEVGSDDL